MLNEKKRNWLTVLQNTVAMLKKSDTIDPNVFDVLRREGTAILTESEQEIIKILTSYIRSLKFIIDDQGMELNRISVTCFRCGQKLPRIQTVHETLYGYGENEDEISHQYTCFACKKALRATEEDGPDATPV